MNNTVSKDEFVSILTETLDNGQDFVFTPTGDSMRPMLNGSTDTVLLTKKPTHLRKHAVALYHRHRDDALVLHRVIKAHPDNTYTFSGDNQYYYDTCIAYDDIFAVVKSYTRNGKTIYVNSLRHSVYSKIILIKKYTRIFLSNLYHKIFK